MRSGFSNVSPSKERLTYLRMGKMEVVLPTDSRYLSLVKKAAALEDDWHRRTLLSEGKAVYSTALPIVAEYRDASVKPLWDIEAGMDDRQAEIKGSNAKYMLPLSLLSKGTAFAAAAIDFYQKHNITVDVAAGKFIVDDENVRVAPRRTMLNIASDRDEYFKFVADIVKDAGVKLSDGDTYLMNNARFLVNVVRYNAANVNDGVNAVLNKITADSDPNTFKRLAVKVYNDYISHSQYTTGITDDDIQIDILNIIVGTVKSRFGNDYDVISAMNRALTNAQREAGKAIEEAAAADGSASDSAAANESGIDDKTVVFIGGNTKDNKDTIKAYADSYGHVVSGGRKSRWYGRQSVWGITHSAWRKMIEDKPSLATELTMRTNYN